MQAPREVEAAPVESAAPPEPVVATMGEEIHDPDESDLEALLPALSQDGRIAVVVSESDCCSGAAVRRGVIIRASQQFNWVLADIDDNGESRVDPATSAANQAAFLAEFEGHTFRTLTSTCAAGEACALSTHRGVIDLVETEDGQLVGSVEGREVVRWHLPELMLPRECCDGGLEEIPECFVRTNRWNLWAAGSMLLVRTAVDSQADGCSSVPSHELLDVAW